MRILNCLKLILFVSLLAGTLNAAQSRKFPVMAGDTVYSVLKKFYFSNEQINQLLPQINQIKDDYELSPRENYWVTVDEKKHKTEVKFFHSLKDESLTIWRKGNQAGLFKQEETYDIKTKTITGKVLGSILASIESKIPSIDIAYRFLDAYKFDFDLKKVIQRNAPFTLVYEEKYLNKQFIRFGEILKTSIEVNSKTENRYFVKSSGGGTFINPKNLQETRPLFAPVDYLKITSDFQTRRLHPIRKRYIAHLGIDFELPLGSDVFASLGGVVERAGFNRAAGNFIVIKHPNGISTSYNHLLYLNRNIVPGAKVKVGQPIAKIGCSGYCTKPHLHFAVTKNDRYLNPIKYLKTYSYNQREDLFNKVASLNKDTSLSGSHN